jgi:hypothetical protein
VGPGGTALLDDPYLPSRSATDLPPPPGSEARSARPAARTGAADRTTVREALAQARNEGLIAVEQHDAWLRALKAARRTRARLTGVRREQLSYAIRTLEDIAGRDALTAYRMPALFLQLERNTEYWPARPYPANGQRVEFEGSQMVFQHYSGRGLQIQPLANFGKANALWRSGRRTRLRALLDELVAIASRRGSFTTWEYWFDFGGGIPPWTSAMSQGTAIQALSRGSVLLEDPSYLAVARSALGAFRTRAPVGVRTLGRDGGRHYLLYSFARGLRVLNAFAQTLNGIHEYGTIAQDQRALGLFELGERSLRAELPDYDTGAWSLYSLGGAEATAEYHALAAQFLGNLCDRLGPGPYCDASTRFEGYAVESPRLALLTTELVEGNTQYVRFTLSKRSTVQMTISRNGQVVWSASGTLAYGTRSLAWEPAEAGDYVVTLSATSFNGTAGSTSGAIAVRPRS